MLGPVKDTCLLHCSSGASLSAAALKPLVSASVRWIYSRIHRELGS